MIAILLSIAAVLVVSNASENTTCGVNRTCISIRDCPHLYALMKPLSLHNFAVLKELHCGFDGKVPKVCCNNNGDPFDDEIVTTTNHHLLPNGDTCGTHIAKNILGGTRLKFEEFPWLTLLIIQTPERFWGYRCGGMLINKRYVLTAAHCVKDDESFSESWKLTAVRLGEYDKDSSKDCFDNGYKQECLKIKPITVPVEKIIRHPYYNNVTYYHDIALLRLSRDVLFNDYVKPVCLPFAESLRQKPEIGAKLTTAGWGQTMLKSSSSIKLKVKLNAISNQYCAAIYSEQKTTVTDKQICAGGRNGRGTCWGDSGGPLMTLVTDKEGISNWYAVGIVSYGVEPCNITSGYPSVYTKVSKYAGWILRNMEP